MILLLLFGRAVLTNYNGMVTFVRLKGKLFQRFEVLLLQFANLSAEYGLGSGSGIDTTGLDGNYGMSTVLEEVVRVERNNTGLIGLGNIGKDTVDHTDEHAVLQRVTSILDDGDDVGAGFGNIDEIAAGSVGEFDSVYGTGGTNNVGHVRNGSTGGGTKIQDLGARLDPDVVNTTENSGGN